MSTQQAAEPAAPTSGSTALPNYLLYPLIMAALTGGVGGISGLVTSTSSATAITTEVEDRIVAKAVKQMTIHRDADLRWLKTEFDHLKTSNEELKVEVKALRNEMMRERLAKP